MKSFEEFKKCCEQYFCLRKSMKSKSCYKIVKQEKCYIKYVDSFNKLTDFTKDKLFRKEILERDVSCRVWAILSKEEKNFILHNHFDDYMMLSTQLDVMHIISRSQRPDLKYDTENVILGSRYFHTLLDNYFDLITKEKMNDIQRRNWIERIMIGNGFWKEGYTYKQFEEDKRK